MSKSVPFMVTTREQISKGDIVSFEGKKHEITSINTVVPFGNHYKIIGRCKPIKSK